ncbi:MAG: carboxypeptidase regulatory-like domain-containing protein [Calditrichaeota bacterium]|nr:MAG: carboxypeptidase regulatory-like domain-containing protein [Calditrichota bacterium]MBL1206256.1 carboxypeptidase regulatory-like domain-containing protein [Calditrichota bacterium]NOG46082.1 carboxypeptidase regulatory-like domain-containing protein [Calditrichota bacterium]
MEHLRLLKIFLLILFTNFFLSCLDDVPHDNPLDSHNNQGFVLQGKVTTFYPPVQTISNAVITLFPDETKFFSNADGEFEISGLSPGKYTVLCSAEGYAQDSITVDIQSNINIDFHLDGLPFFENISLTTHHEIHSFQAEDFFFLNIESMVNDLDGIADINKVFFEIPEVSVIDTLEPSLDAGLFRKWLSIDDLPVSTIQTLIGRAFILNVSDDAGTTTQSEKRFLTRVIEQTPSLTAPISFQTEFSDTLIFEWQKLNLSYWFEYTIEISQIIQGSPVKAQDISNISASENSIAIVNTLSRGDYTWLIKVTDEFGNTSSSSSNGRFHIN